MTIIDTRSPEPTRGRSSRRSARTRHYVMCEPTHFAVEYAINPWMDPSVPVDSDRAVRQWEALRRTYLALGHRVDVVPAAEGQPDMVFAANGGLTIAGRTYGALFRHPQRQAEAGAFSTFLRERGLDVTEPAPR